MDQLRSLIVPALLGTCLSLTGCTGINPFNWASIDGRCCHDSECCESCDSDMMPEEYGEYEGGPLMQSRSHGLLSRGILREHWNLARSFEESGDTEQAAAHYEKILSIQPDYAPAHHRLGVLATMWGRFGDADNHFRLARRTPGQETATEVVTEGVAQGETEGVTEESYIQENMISEREAEEKVKREIAAEQGEAQQAAGSHQQSAVTKPTRKRYQIGARLVDAYYAQQERRQTTSVAVPPEESIPQQRIVGKSRNAETITTAKTSKSAPSQAASSSNSTRNYEKAARTQPRQAAKEYYVETEEEQAEEASEVEEERSTSQSTRSNSSPQATIRPTASSVRRSTSQAPLSRSAQVRQNTLRPEQEELPTESDEVAETTNDSTISREVDRVAETHITGTSGIRRISNQEPETFAAEERDYAETIARLSAVREREKSARAEFLEAEVEARVAQELEISLAERRLKLASAQLRLARQQLDSAIKAAGGEMPVQQQEIPAQAIESLDEAEPQRSSESRDSLPAPRRLKVQQTSAVEPEGKDFLAGLTGEPQAAAGESELNAGETENAAGDSANSLNSQEASDVELAGANLPAETPGAHVAQLAEAIDQAEVEPAILLSSHAEESEPAEFDDADASELRQKMPEAGAENPAIRARHTLQQVQHLPDERAHQPEPAIRTLDEQTLRRREVTTRTTFAKKAHVLPSTVLYR